MSEQNKNCGAAFPTLTYDQGAAMNGIGVSVTDHPGMTLRDYFAAKAMQSLISKHGFISDEINFAAKHSYEIADAMLKAREASDD